MNATSTAPYRQKNSYTVSMNAAAFLGILVSFAPFITSAATMYLDPSAGTYGRGDTFVMSVRLNTNGECINTASAEIKYPTDTLRAVDFSRGGSILSLWVEEPKIDEAQGIVRFAGGIPGGYCGRIQGDPVQTNILGKIVFTVIDAKATEARVVATPASSVYLNDGEGTRIELETAESVLQIVELPTLPENEWLETVGADDVPPDAFQVFVESTRGVLGGDYFLVFSTVDKQSGLDHYEIFERDAWKTVSSPYRLRDQALRLPIEVRAIDKAGNERLGIFDPQSVPERESLPRDYLIIALIIALLVVAALWRIIQSRRSSHVDVPPLVP